MNRHVGTQSLPREQDPGRGWMPDLLLMDEILHHLGALNYCNSWEFRDLW